MAGSRPVTAREGQDRHVLLGTFAAQQFAKGAEQEDLGFFNFPEIDSAIGADVIEAPTDGFMMSKRPKNEAGAKKWLSYLGSGAAQDILVQTDPSVIATSGKADTAKYTSLQKQSSNWSSPPRTWPSSSTATPVPTSRRP